jgi:negative regulator of sigma-B (phosphoserine phosphatase)
MDPVKPSGAQARPLSLVDFGVAQIPHAGQTVSGDRHTLSPFPDGMLLAVADGLGHGTEAAAAADAAIATLEAHPEEPVIALLKRCHEALKGTRGAALSLVSFNRTYSTITWLGVGNVEGVLLLRADPQTPPAHDSIMLFPGVVGHQMPALRAVVTPISAGDLLILYTDGIRRDFLSEPPIPGHSPQRIADRICSKYTKGTDDALVSVVRYMGGPPWSLPTPH